MTKALQKSSKRKKKNHGKFLKTRTIQNENKYKQYKEKSIMLNEYKIVMGFRKEVISNPKSIEIIFQKGLL